MPLRKKSPQLVTDLRPNTKRPSPFAPIKKFIKKNTKPLLIGLVALVIVTLAYGYISTRNELKRLSDPKKASQNETQDLVSKVGKLIELPSGETPTIATVKDSSKLKNQEFFARAKNGDRVLIYSNSGRAVLYRPTTNKVVEYSKVNLNTNQ